jgi:hypothetical protein
MAVAAVAEFRQLTSPPVEQPSTSPPVCRLPASPLAAWPFATSWPWTSWQRISLPWISWRTTSRGLTWLSRAWLSRIWLAWTWPALACAVPASAAAERRVARGPDCLSRVLQAPGPPNNRINFEIVCTGLSAPHHEFTTSLRKSLPSHRHPRYSERTTMRCLDNTDTLRRR